jgi:hypothetical protein
VGAGSATPGTGTTPVGGHAVGEVGGAASAVSVQIGALVVDGLSGSPSRGVHVGQALGPALERLFEQRGVPERWQAGGAVESLALTIADLPPDAADWRVVDALARALYRALDRSW